MKSVVLAILAAITVMSAPNASQAEEAAMAEAPVFLMIRFNVAEPSVPEFLEIMTNINDLMASEEGFMSATVYRDNDDPLSFTLIETWKTRALHREHYDRIVENGDWENILGMLTAEPDMSYNGIL